MADPVSLSTIGLGTSAAGGAFSALGNIFSGNSQKQMYDYQSQVALINANIDKQNAEWELNKGELEATQKGMQAGQQFGQIVAGQGASNLDVNSGSNRLVQQSQQKLTQMDLSTIRANAAKNAYDYTVKSVQDTNQAAIYTQAGKNAQTAGYIGAASSIIGSAGSVASKWIQGSTAGIGGSGPIKLFGPDQTVTGYG